MLQGFRPAGSTCMRRPGFGSRDAKGKTTSPRLTTYNIIDITVIVVLRQLYPRKRSVNSLALTTAHI